MALRKPIASNHTTRRVIERTRYTVFPLTASHLLWLPYIFINLLPSLFDLLIPLFRLEVVHPRPLESLLSKAHVQVMLDGIASPCHTRKHTSGVTFFESVDEIRAAWKVRR